MQTQPRRSVTALLVLAVVAVFGMGAASAAFVSGYHAPTAEKTGVNAPTGAAAGLTAFLHPTLQPTVYAKVHKSTSGNWAGYADVAKTTGTITEAFGEWYSPTGTCNEPSGAAYQVEWVGIDGFNNGNVTQAGTEVYCSGPGASPQYYDWYEFYPYESVQIISGSGADVPVTVYILYNPTLAVDGVAGVYTIELYDPDFGVSFSIVGGGWVCHGADCEGGPDGTAECISEAPTVGGVIANLADYGSTTIYACSDTIGTHTTGIGAQKSGTTIFKINQIGASTLTDQSTGGLSTYLYKDDTFTITWDDWN